VTIPYYPLSPEMLTAITQLQLGRIVRRMQENHGVVLDYAPEVLETIVARCQELESGGRMIDSILTNTMLPAISNAFLTRLMEGEPINGVKVGVTDADFVYEFE